MYHFIIIYEFKLELQSGHANFGSKSMIFFCPAWPWNLTDDLTNNRGPILCYFKFYASVQGHWCIQTWATFGKPLIWVKIKKFVALWPLNVTNDLKNQYGTSPKHHHALCSISSSYVNSNWSYGPETVKMGFDLCDLDLWSPTLTFCMDITSVIGNKFWKFHDDTMMGT